MAHYHAIAEREEGSTWSISFRDRPGITLEADDAVEIATRAQNALASALTYRPGNELPLSIEDGAKPAADLPEFEQSTIVVVIPFEGAVYRAAA